MKPLPDSCLRDAHPEDAKNPSSSAQLEGRPCLPDLPDLPRVIAKLTSRAHCWAFEVVESTGSTNADLMQRFAKAREQTLAEARLRPVVRIAGVQTAGRGRQGRTWEAAPGDALLLSLAYPIALPLFRLSGLSLALGCATLSALRRLPLREPNRLGLKWPNDILCDEAKLGGILIEIAATCSHETHLVIGIGINLRQTQSGVPNQRRQTPGTPNQSSELGRTALETLLDGEVRFPHLSAELLTHLLDALAHALETFETHGFAAFRAAWWADHAYRTRAVSILEGGAETLRGTAVDIDDEGRLLLCTSHGQVPIVAGDVSLRPLSPLEELDLCPGQQHRSF